MLEDFEELKINEYLKCESAFVKFLKNVLPNGKELTFKKINNPLNHFFVYDIIEVGVLINRLIIKSHVYNLKEKDLSFTTEDEVLFKDLACSIGKIAFIQIDRFFEPIKVELIQKNT